MTKEKIKNLEDDDRTFSTLVGATVIFGLLTWALIGCGIVENYQNYDNPYGLGAGAASLGFVIMILINKWKQR